MPGFRGQLFQIEELRAAIAFPERVDIIHIAHDRSCSLGERGRAQTLEETRFFKPMVNIRHSRLDEAAELELIAVFRDFDGAKFPGPIVKILEKMTMDGAEMSQIEHSAGDSSRDTFDDQPALSRLQLCGIGNAELVSEDGGAGIEIRIAVRHSAAKDLARAMR